jgi:hypothetical protein
MCPGSRESPGNSQVTDRPWHAAKHRCSSITAQVEGGDLGLTRELPEAATSIPKFVHLEWKGNPQGPLTQCTPQEVWASPEVPTGMRSKGTREGTCGPGHSF